MPEQQAKQPMQPPFPLDTVEVKDLDLDLRNSRFPRDAQSQDDALHLMMVTAGEQCLQLLRDIMESGQLNSADLPIVVERGGRFVTMEGNRRLTCLRIWHDPATLSADAEIEQTYQTRVRRLVAESAYSAPTQIQVAIAPSEAAADPWIDRKHAGGSGGAGTVQWGAAMKDRRKARNNPASASRAMAFIELVSTKLEDEHDIQADLETVRTERYTMIQRFVDRGIVRERLGLEFDAGRMTFSHGAEATAPIVRAVLHDFAQPKAESGKTWARELDTVADFANYLDLYAHLLPGATVRAAEFGAEPASSFASAAGGVGAGDRSGGDTRAKGTFDSATASAGGELLGGSNGDSRPLRPTAPLAHIFRGLVLDKFTNRIQEIVRQTSMLNVQRQTEVASVLLRVILDLTTYQFLMSHGKTPERHLDKNLRTAIKQVDPQASDALGQAESTSQLRKAFHETSPDSIRLIQYAVHDVHSGRTPNEVLILAERYQPVLVAMNMHMGNRPIT
ncbi:hypothetical protein J4G33_10105 [Actinotalea sp. BY-33]|uniref:ParB/Sulfiredoxin domain-containing protein n=1 Tax=Actinotalea soli TaxID=2819234 RepID=A0A939RWG1_9CELL|nr:hypothetical protein [Actinotalea soli]MBO1752156.1 hypothetical protein [Actinotalea soli]